MRFAAIVLTFVALWAGSATAAPLAAYGRLPSLSEMALSPDGAKLAFVQSDGVKSIDVVLDIKTQAPVAEINLGDAKFAGNVWADDGHLLLLTRTTARGGVAIAGDKHEFLLIQSYDLASKRSINLLKDPRNAGLTMNTAFGMPRPRKVGDHTIVYIPGILFPPQYEDTKSRRALFAADLTSGVTQLAEGENRNAEDWLIDTAGHVLAESDYDPVKQRWSLMFKRDGHWTEVYAMAAAIDRPTMEGLSADGGAVIVRGADGRGLQSVNLTTGAATPAIGPEQGLTNLIFDPQTRRIIGGSRLTMAADTVFFDPHDQALWLGILAANPGADVRIVSWSKDRSKIVLQVAGPVEGDIYELLDTGSHRVDILGQVYDGIGAADFASVSIVSYAAADGRQLSAYLTLPKGRQAANLPLIVLPHGGPAARDWPGFDWWAQGLAAQGYAVLQPQFRGTRGLGGALLQAGYGEWGRKMQSDLSDGVRYLAGRGMVDSRRVCIVGGSYGGYAALAGAALDRGIYRCAVAVAGVSDLRDLILRDLDPAFLQDNPTVRYWDRFIGADTPDAEVVREFSPINHADAVSIPVLLIHGKDDTVVPISQSRRMLEALKSAGKDADLIELPGEDHWLSRGDTRQQMLSATVMFLRKNNPTN
jgi:dipeptidyl aminopeptidase/acylaminoacyl peptidase